MSSLVWIVLGVFALTLVAGLVRKLRKDDCLRFLDGSRVSFVGPEGRALWGEMELTSQGFTLHFDATHVDERGLEESGAVVFTPKISKAIALCRTDAGLTDAQRELRARQVGRVLHPSRAARSRRTLANVGGMARDALVDTIGLLVGQLSTARGKPVAALADRQRQVGEAGGAILDLGARAYEPLLDQNIGRAVIVRIDVPGSQTRHAYFPGFLADYNEKYLVVVNDSLAPESRDVVRVGAQEDGAFATATFADEHLHVACACDDAVVVRRVVGRSAALDLAAVLLPGAELSLHVPDGFGAHSVEVERTRRLDFVCPRARSLVRFTSARPPLRRDPWSGVGPGWPPSPA